MPDLTGTAANAVSGPAKAPNGGAASAAERIKAVTEGIRSRTDLTAKAIGGIGTTLVTAVGLSKLGDVYPIPPNFYKWGWPIAVPLGFLGMGLAVGGLTFRFWNVSQPVIMTSNPDTCTNMDFRERELVRPIYQEIASLNQVPSLAAYERKAQRFHRIADRCAASLADLIHVRASEIEGDILVTEARSNLIVIRNRAKDAVRGHWSILLYATFVGSALLFAIGANKLDSERAQQITIAKNCADAVKAGADGSTLPAICKASSSGSTKGGPKQSPKQLAAENAGKLAATLSDCLAKAADSGLPDTSCDSIRTALIAAANGP